MSNLVSPGHMRPTRTRATEHAARKPKGHPKRAARQQRAADRLAAHVYDPDRCKPGCPKR